MVVPDVMNRITNCFFFFTVAFQLLAHILQIHTHKHQTGTTNLFIRNSFPSGRQSTVIRWWDVLTWDFLTQVVLICIFIFFDSIVFLLFLTVHPSVCLSQLFYSFAVAVTTAFILCLQTFFVDGLYMKVIHSTSLCTVHSISYSIFEKFLTEIACKANCCIGTMYIVLG